MTRVAPVGFQHERIRDGLYRMSEAHYNWLNRPNIWLVRGRDADMLVDTGLGVSGLKLYLADLLDKHLKVVASHVHFDHSGSCHEFDDVCIHRNEHEALRRGDQDMMLASPACGWVPQEDFQQLPYEGFAASSYAVKACPQAKAISDGDVIDLGDRAFEVRHLPGHSSARSGYTTAGKAISSVATWSMTASCSINFRTASSKTTSPPWKICSGSKPTKSTRAVTAASTGKRFAAW